MTKAELEEMEELEAKFKKLDKEDQERILRLAEQLIRAGKLGLSVCYDAYTNYFFLADVETNTVVAPPPMNLATVTAWLDDYEQEAAAEE